MKYIGILLGGMLSASLNAQTWREQITLERLSKDSTMRDTAQTALLADSVPHFTGLDYFPIDTAYVVTARFEKAGKEGKKQVPIKNKKGIKHPHTYYKAGTLYFELMGKTCSLAVYRSPEIQNRPGLSKHMFLPFLDLTNNVDTYGGGRYLDLDKQKSKTYIIDFNRAYNPYCAYGGNYLCPIPPAENFLNLRIEAGEKTYE